MRLYCVRSLLIGTRILHHPPHFVRKELIKKSSNDEKWFEVLTRGYGLHGPHTHGGPHSHGGPHTHGGPRTHGGPHTGTMESH